MIPDALLEPVQSLLDRGVVNSTTAGALCARLEGCVLQMRPAPEKLALNFSVSKGRLLLTAGTVDKPDAIISGSVLNLARLGGNDPEAAIRDGYVSISGDADIAADFRALLAIVRPDWEEELSRLTGDVVAHEAGRAVRGFAGWAARARHSLGRSVAEYLSEESRDLAAVAELEEFNAEVDQLAMSVDRLEARFKAFKEQADNNEASKLK
jgi:ubiquinone biosynthesis protein UbiJ